MRLAAPRWHMIDEIDLVRLIADHSDLARLCAELEQIADRLPDRPPPDALARFSDRLEGLLLAHETRERAVFADLLDMRSLPTTDRALLTYIGDRRTECVVQGQDVAAAFRRDDSVSCAETLGYMLRCFFQSCRQAMAFEELAILGLGAGRFTPSAALALRDSLRARCTA